LYCPVSVNSRRWSHWETEKGIFRIPERNRAGQHSIRVNDQFGTDAQSWLNLQSHYDIQCAEDASGKSIKRIQPCQALGKVRAMA
jgi:hypothetical protein